MTNNLNHIFPIVKLRPQLSEGISAIMQINHYLLDKYYENLLSYVVGREYS